MNDLPAYARLAERLAALELDECLSLAPDQFPAAPPERLPLAGLVVRRPTRRFISWTDAHDHPFEVTDMCLAGR